MGMSASSPRDINDEGITDLGLRVSNSTAKKIIQNTIFLTVRILVKNSEADAEGAYFFFINSILPKDFSGVFNGEDSTNLFTKGNNVSVLFSLVSPSSLPTPTSTPIPSLSQ